MEFLGENGIPFCIIFTKTDKLRKHILLKNIDTYQKIMLKTWEVMPQYFITSAIDKTGKDQVITFIDNVNEKLNSN